MLGAPVRRRIVGKQTRAVPRHRLYGKQTWPPLYEQLAALEIRREQITIEASERAAADLALELELFGNSDEEPDAEVDSLGGSGVELDGEHDGSGPAPAPVAPAPCNAPSLPPGLHASIIFFNCVFNGRTVIGGQSCCTR